MKLAIMQPYFFPYIGYWQLLEAVDEFIIYDNIEYTKKGWINRNRILDNGTDSYITIPIKKDSDFLDVKDRHIAKSFEQGKNKMLAKIKSSYAKAPEFDNIFPIVEKIINFENDNLFDFVRNSLETTKEYLNIKTPLTPSSSISLEANLKAEKKVIAICKEKDADTYINAIGGVDLYDKKRFLDNKIDLKFLKSKDINYRQFDNAFVPGLSIIDVMMFNTQEQIKEYLKHYSLV